MPLENHNFLFWDNRKNILFCSTLFYSNMFYSRILPAYAVKLQRHITDPLSP